MTRRGQMLEFQRDEGGHRYRALLEGEEVGFVEVDAISTDRMLIKHTEVLPDFERRGFGGALIVHVLEDARRLGRGVIPICPYASAYIKRHPEYMEYVTESYRAVLGQRSSPLG